MVQTTIVLPIIGSFFTESCSLSTASGGTGGSTGRHYWALVSHATHSCCFQAKLPGPCPPSRDLCTLGVITISPFTSRLFPGALPPLLPLHCHNNTVNYIGSQVDPQWPFPLKTRSIIHRLLLGAEWHGPIYQRLLFNMG